ncbi:MAG: nucleotidyltransferase family protein [candidate division NC10 bacterium]|nr:nucleotidyltransferase family protein [candidate division NC10 bacterium]
MPEVPERRLLLTAGRLFLGTAQDEEAVALLCLPLNWSSLFEKAAAEGMSGLLAFQLQQLARAYPLNLPLDPLTQALHGIFVQNGAFFAELSALREELRRRGLQAILLKGGALLKTVYHDYPGVRPLSDLDLLIKPPDLPSMVELLKKRGFHPSSPASTFFLNGSVAFDIHTDLIGAARIRRRGLACQFDPEILWQQASPLDPQDPTLLVLSPPHQFLHLVVHALKHSFSRLIWFVDLGLLVGAGFHPARLGRASSPPLQCVKWEELLGWAEATGTLRALAYALFGLERLLMVEVPQEVQARLPRFNRMEHMFLDRVVSRQAREMLGEVLVMFSIPDLKGKLGYLLEFGFPRQEVLAEVFPSTPSWLLYPRRLLQGMAVGLREGRHVMALVKRRNGR